MHTRPIPLSVRTQASVATPPPRLFLVLAGALAAVFVASHVPLVSETLDGIDSTNFILAVDSYNPRLHQPHPPGYPVHVALGRVVTSLYRTAGSGEHQAGTAVASLRIWSVLCGGIAIVAMMGVALGLGLSAWRAAVATALVALCPLFWITAMRPLSDVPGLMFAMISQALALWAARRGAVATPLDEPRWWSQRLREDGLWFGAACVAGLAMGVRVQTSLLTLPLLMVLLTLHLRRASALIVPGVMVAFLTGVAVWAVPLALTLGGPGEYFRLLTTVAADDVQGVEMLATQFSPRLGAVALLRTFVVPWDAAALGSVVVALAMAGAISQAIWQRRALALAVLMSVPYLIFHVLFQETASIRYALPLVPFTAFLVVGALRKRTAWLVASTLAVVVGYAATTSVGAALAYGRTESPVARALEDSTLEAAGRSAAPTLAFHHAVGRAIRGEHWPGPSLVAPVRYEWLELAKYWRDGNRGVVWFLADDRRTDLALIDPTARRVKRSYRWPDAAETLLGGIQPPRLSWYEMTTPGWFLMRGWALTPETHGVSTRDREGPGVNGASGYIRRRDGAAMMFIGGRNLGGPCDTAARVEVRIDGEPRASWITPSRSAFLEKVTFPAGALVGRGEYAEVTIVARDVTTAGRLVDVAIDQFDIQSAGSVMTGFGHGWHMPELDAATGVTWHWMEEVAELNVESFARGAQVTIRGESPLRHFQAAPRVRVSAANVELGAFAPASDFEWTIRIPAEVLVASEGRLTITTDRSFVPDEMSGNGDRRRLGLRIFSVSGAPSN